MKKLLSDQISDFSIICVTGQMAAGKNYVCSQLEKSGWISTDLDQTAHLAIELYKDEIISDFEGEAKKLELLIQNPDGSINRRNLGKLLFKNPSLLARQESIIYPAIIKMTREFIDKNLQKKIIINATLLYKTPALLELCDAIVFVKAPFLTRLLRAHSRDFLPFRQILRRFHAQKNLLKDYKKSGKKIIFVKNFFHIPIS